MFVCLGVHFLLIALNRKYNEGIDKLSHFMLIALNRKHKEEIDKLTHTHFEFDYQGLVWDLERGKVMKTELKKKSNCRISFIIDTSSTISLLKNVRPSIMIESLLDCYCNFFHSLLSLCLSFLYPHTFRAPKKAK